MTNGPNNQAQDIFHDVSYQRISDAPTQAAIATLINLLPTYRSQASAVGAAPVRWTVSRLCFLI
jgi:hypothetical protein